MDATSQDLAAHLREAVHPERIAPDELRKVPRTIAVAVGAEKVPSIVGAARAGLYNRLVTDLPTALAILKAGDRP